MGQAQASVTTGLGEELRSIEVDLEKEDFMVSATGAKMRMGLLSRLFSLTGAMFGALMFAAACTELRPIPVEEKSDPSESLDSVPGAPTGIVANAGNATAAVSWRAPASDGGAAILTYTVTSSPSGFTATVGGDTLQATVEGLVNGTTYTFTVTATNKAGTSAPSVASNAVVPRTVPAAPVSVSASAGHATATVTWAAPSSDGGSEITGYTVSSSPAGFSAQVERDVLEATFVGLPNGSTFTFTVSATNVAGIGPSSAPSNEVTPHTTPGTPQAVTAVAGDARATVRWTAPESDGGSAIIRYEVTSMPGARVTEVGGDTTAATIEGLANGTPYKFVVTAINAAGMSPVSAPSNEVMPVEPASTTLSELRVPPRAVLADGEAFIALQATVRNAAGELLAGYPLRVRSSETSDVFSLGEGYTAQDGTFTTQVRATAPGERVFTAQLGLDSASEVTATATFLDPDLQCRGLLTLGDRPVQVLAGRPVALAVADLNGDGLLDVVGVRWREGVNDRAKVSVLLGRGGGLFDEQVEYDMLINPSNVKVVDVNNDGHLDILATGLAQTVLGVFIGAGDGSFVNMTTGLSITGGSAFDVGDVNGDGLLDVVSVHKVTADRTHQLVVAPGHGDGRFTAEVGYAEVGTFKSLVLGDLDGDGHLDIVFSATHEVGGQTGYVAVRRGRGDGTFGDRIMYQMDVGPSGLALADFNGDSILDLAISQVSADLVGIQLGVGDGSFGARVDYPVSPRPERLHVGDVDSDGITDLLVSSGSGGAALTVLKGVGDGGFVRKLDYRVPPGLSSAAMADVDGDGRLDVVYGGYTSHSIDVVFDIGMADQEALPVLDVSMVDVNLSDLDRDGRLDIIVSALSGGFMGVFLGRDDGSMEQVVKYPVGRSPRSLVTGDLDSDGVPDVVVANEGDATLSVLLGRGDGTFIDAMSVPVGRMPDSLRTGDLNRDGCLDVVFSHRSDRAIGVLLGQCDGTFESMVVYETVDRPMSLAIGDVNHDGFLDLVSVQSPADGIEIMYGRGDGVFVDRHYVGLGSSYVLVELEDVNGDGRLDIVAVRSRANSLIEVFLGRDDGGFDAVFVHQYEVNVWAVRLGDMDGDGVVDVLATIPARNLIALHLGRGDGGFQSPLFYTVGRPGVASWRFALGDLNGDGRLDAVAPHSDSISILMNECR